MDLNLLIEKVTAEVMRVIEANNKIAKICVVSEQKESGIVSALESASFLVSEAKEPCALTDFVLLSRAKYDEIIGDGKGILVKNEGKESKSVQEALDWTSRKVITEKDVRGADLKDTREIRLNRRTVVTALAFDAFRSCGIKLIY